MTIETKVKSFFDKPEGNTGLIFMCLGLLAFFGLGWYFLPIILIVLTNTLYAMLLGGAIFVLAYLAMNDQFMFLVWSLFKSVMRWITGWFVAIDPIGILKNYLSDMKERIEKFNYNIAQLVGQITKIDQIIRERKETAEHFMKLASKAKEKEQNAEAMLNANKARREIEFVDRLSVNLQKMQKLKDVLTKIHTNLVLLYEDTQHNVEIKEFEYKSTTAAYTAMRGAKALIEGDKAKDLFDEAMSHIADDVAMKLGEMDRFMETNDGLFKNMDLENAVFDEEGLDTLLNWEHNGGILTYDTERNHKVRVETTDPTALIEQHEIENTRSERSSFADVFKK